MSEDSQASQLPFSCVSLPQRSAPAWGILSRKLLLSSIYQSEELFENSLNSTNGVLVAVNYYILSYIEFSMIFLFLLYI